MEKRTRKNAITKRSAFQANAIHLEDSACKKAKLLIFYFFSSSFLFFPLILPKPTISEALKSLHNEKKKIFIQTGLSLIIVIRNRKTFLWLRFNQYLNMPVWSLLGSENWGLQKRLKFWKILLYCMGERNCVFSVIFTIKLSSVTLSYWVGIQLSILLQHFYIFKH